MSDSCRIVIGFPIKIDFIKGVEACETGCPAVVNIDFFQKFFYGVDYAGSSWIGKFSGKFGKRTPHGITFLVYETLNV